VAQIGPYADNLHLAPNRYYISTSSFNFYTQDPLPDTPTNSVKTLKAVKRHQLI